MFKLRFWWVLLWAMLSRNREVTSSHLRFWVTLFDCDINLHCNNASYLKYMDLGRWDLILRQRMVWPMIKARLQPAAVHIEIDYRKALPPGTFITMDTEVEAIRGKSFDVRQKFYVGQELVANAKVTVVLIHKGHAAPTEKFLDLLPDSLRQKAKAIPKSQ